MPGRGGLWQGSKWIRRERRLAIYIRDGWRCVWCGSTTRLSLDHILPNHVRWDNATRNLVTSCLGCNCRRQGRRLGRWLRDLRREGVNVSSVVGRLRTQICTDIDLSAGRAAVAGDRARRRAAGADWRRTVWDPTTKGSAADAIPF